MMTSSVAVPLHLAVHVLGVAVTLALAVHALVRRRGDAPAGWLAVLVGAALLTSSHVGAGALVAGAAWPVYARIAGYAALAVGLSGGPSGLPAVTVVGPLGAHWAAALTGLLSAVSAVMGRGGRGREGLVLAAGLALWAGSDLVAFVEPVPAAVLSLAGSAAVGAWLLARSRSSLLSRLVASFLAALLVLVVGVAAAAGVLFAADLRGNSLQRLDELTAARADQVQQDWPDELVALARSLSGGMLATRLGAATDLDAQAQRIAALPGIDVVVLVNSDREVVGSWDRGVRDGPLTPADELRIGGHESVSRALAGSDSHSMVDVGQTDLLAVAAVPVAPVEAGQRRLDLQTGVLVVARRVSDVLFVNEVRQRSDADAAVVVGGRVAASTLPPELSVELAAQIAATASAREVRLGGQPRFLATAPVRGPDGTELGTIALVRDAATVAGAEGGFTRNLFLAAVASAAAAALLGAAASTHTTRPVRELTAAAERVAAGDLDATVQVDRTDEMGRLADAFNAMTGSLVQRDSSLREAATTEAGLRGRLEAVTASMTEALLAVDDTGTVRTVNPAATKLLATPRERLLGRPVGEVLRGTDQTGAPLLEALGTHRSGQVAIVRGTVGGAFGVAIPVAASAAPLRAGDGSLAGRVYVLRDVTGEAQAERMKTEFLANVSHELRTPLTPIKGYVELLRSRKVEPDRVMEVAGAMASSVSLLERIIGMLLDFAALEAGRLEVRLEPTHLDAVVGDVVADWRQRAPQRRISRRLASDLPPVVADPDLLNRVLTELVHNAIKFSDGPIQIRGGIVAPGQVRLTVSDTGQGIAPEDLERITREFQQLDGSATRRYGGLGLGLTLVRRIVERFGGRLTIESEIDGGTEVHLDLRVADREVPQ